MKKLEDFVFKTISKNSSASFVEKGSKFLSFACKTTSLSQVKENLQKIQNTYSKANHCVYAYRVNFNKPIFKMKDAGEPSGTAGLPVFQIIEKFELFDVLISVVRYFGGTLLGKGGLVRAYGKSANLALQNTSIVVKEIQKDFLLTFNSVEYSLVYEILKSLNAQIKDSKIELFRGSFHFSISLKEVQELHLRSRAIKDCILLSLKTF